MIRTWLIAAAVGGFLSVTAGAAATHIATGERAAELLRSGALYGMVHATALIAVTAVTYMIVWMRRNARGLKAELQDGAARALASGSTGALIGMAFLAVLREGFETAVFLLAVFQDTSNTTAANRAKPLMTCCQSVPTLRRFMPLFSTPRTRLPSRLTVSVPNGKALPHRRCTARSVR